MYPKKSSALLRDCTYKKIFQNLQRMFCQQTLPAWGKGRVRKNRDSEVSVPCSFCCCRILNSKREKAVCYQRSLKVEHVPEYGEGVALAVGRL